MAERLIYEDTDKRIWADGEGEDRTDRVEWINAAATEARLAAAESRLDAVAAKANEAAVTAQEVANAARPQR